MRRGGRRTAIGGSLSAVATRGGYALLWLTLRDPAAHVVIRRHLRRAALRDCEVSGARDWERWLSSRREARAKDFGGWKAASPSRAAADLFHTLQEDVPELG